MSSASQELESLVDSTVTIPTIPTVLVEIQEVVNDPNGCTADAAAIIQRDPAIGAKMLRLVNSPLYALKNAVTAIPLACSILGLKVVHNVVVQATVIDQFGEGPELGNFDLRWLWDHSFKTAMAARMLVREASVEVEMSMDEGYTSGLIHDIGKIILLQSDPTRFGVALKCSREQDIPLARAEAELLGFTHAHVGGLLADRWRLAPILQAAVMYHHSPGADPNDCAAGFLIKAANTLAHRAATTGGGYAGDLCDDDALQALGIPQERLDEITLNIQDVSVG
jgi:HD-like signal output (HDOD) protein